MTRHPSDVEDLIDLRERARKILRDHTFDTTLEAHEQGQLDLQRLLEELHIYHAELYVQQQALHESQRANERSLARFTQLYQEQPLPTLLMTRDGMIQDANTAARGLLAFDRRLFIHLSEEGQSALLSQALARTWSEGRALCREVHLRGANGGRLVADLYLIRLPARDDEESEIVCNLIDQTEIVTQREALMAANQRLRVQEERYHVVADFAPDWAYWMGEDGHFRYVSPACEQITGYPASAFLADASLLTRIVHEADRPAYEAHLHHEEQDLGRAPLHFRIQTRRGETR